MFRPRSLLFAGIIFLQALAAGVSAEGFEINGPFISPAGTLTILRPVGGGPRVKWTVVPDTTNFFAVEDGSVAIFTSGVSGAWTFVASTIVDGEIEQVQHMVTVGNGPTPDPDPSPDPIPPTPTPTPGPITALMIYETEDLGKPAMRPYLNVLNSSEVRGYLSAHCAKNTKGVPEWRVWDKDTNVTNESDFWKKMMTSTPPDLPAIIISGGGKSVTTKLPSTVQETLDLLKKWGGP